MRLGPATWTAPHVLEAALAATSKEHGGRQQAVDHEERALIAVGGGGDLEGTRRGAAAVASALHDVAH